MTLDKNKQDLLENGFCTVPNVLDDGLRERLRHATDERLNALGDKDREKFRSQGSMLPTTIDPLFADLISLPAALDALKRLGFNAATFSDGYVISKPGHSPRLFWHYDWFAWEDARSYENPPPQIFLMYYLSDTRPDNGCLRVIPGSHIRHNALHDLLRAPHSADLGAAKDLETAPEFSDRPDEVSVPVKAGDVVIGDARILHATHANTTDERRTVITLWFQPDLSSLPERIQAQLAAKVQPVPSVWPDSAKAKVEILLTRYSGEATPYGRTLYRAKAKQ